MADRKGLRGPPLGKGAARSTSGTETADWLLRAGIGQGVNPEARTSRAIPSRRRGIASREQIVTATRAVLKEYDLADLTPTRIASAAGCSRAAFYQYFEDVQHVLLELAAEASKPFIQLAADLAPAPDSGETDMDWATRLVDGFIDAWRQDPRILLYRNLESDRGDQRFMSLRIQTLLPLTQRLVERLLSHRPQLCPEEAIIEAGMIISLCGQIAIQHATPGNRVTDLPSQSLIHVIARMLSSRS